MTDYLSGSSPRAAPQRAPAHWRAYHFYLTNLDDFLANRLPSVVALFRAFNADRYFFIRYWSGGPHIRLRIGFPSEAAARMAPDASALQAMAKIDDVRIRSELYIPEIQRYGGPQLIRSAEDQFVASSAVVLYLLHSRQLTRSTAYHAAIVLNMLFLKTALRDARKVTGAFGHMSEALEQYLGAARTAEAAVTITTLQEAANPSVLSIIQSCLRNDPDPEATPWVKYWVSASSHYGDRIALIRENPVPQGSRDAQHSPTTLRILGSLTHMTCNRIGLSNLDEYSVYNVIHRYLKSNHASLISP